MSKKDKIKEKINYLKFWIGVCVASLISLGTWLSINFGKFSNLYIIGIILFIFLLVFIIFLDKKIRELINNLEEL